MQSNLKEELSERRFDKKVEKFINSSVAIFLSLSFVLMGLIAWYNLVVLAK